MMSVCTSARGLKRELSRVVSDSVQTPVEEGPGDVYDPNNARHTRRELHRYMKALNKEMHNALFITFGGPDGTKVGTDYNVTAAVIGNSSTGKVGLAPPQDLGFCFRCVSRVRSLRCDVYARSAFGRALHSRISLPRA